MVKTPFACLYLHGFLSSPLSKKAQQLSAYFKQHYPSALLSIPALAFEPNVAIQQAQEALAELKQHTDNIIIIGSSLGGFYATYLSATHHCKAALINPAVRPFDLFEHYLGPNKHFYTDEVHELTMEHIEQLKALDTPCINAPEQLFLLLQTGDETLDYKQAAKLYQACPSWLESAGNHSFEGFIERLPMILAWAKCEAF